MVSIFAVCSMHPVNGADIGRQGVVLYFCMPVGADLDRPTHYLSVLGVTGVSNSELVFSILRRYSVYSYQWLTYYLVGSGCNV